MTVKVLYFAALREKLGCAQEELSLPADVRTLGALRELLAARGEAWNLALAPGRNLRAAHNQRMADAATQLADGDEVAFFPPVTGG